MTTAPSTGDLVQRANPTAQSKRLLRWGSLAIAALSVSTAPRDVSAALPGDRVDFAMYGRMGVGWNLNGQLIHGKVMNLTTERFLGGRFEENDYLQPTITAHIVKPAKDKPESLYIDAVLTPAVFARNGSFLGFFSTPAETFRMELFEMYVEAGNMGVPGIVVWAGARFHRSSYVHLADYWYFNDLTAQGAGVKYKGFDLAVLVHSSPGAAAYSFDSTVADDNHDLDVQRVRTIVAAQYTVEFGKEKTSYVQGLAEGHLLPPAKKGNGPELAPADFGWVAGLKLSLDLGNGNLNDTSVRYGSRIANGAKGGTQTFDTFGPPQPDGKYDGAYGVEVVEHFLFNIGSIFSINGYGALNISQSALTPDEVTPEQANAGVVDKTLDWVVSARGTIYAHRIFHMLAEASVQGRKDGDKDMGTAVKVSVVPTLVPTGETTVWGRPHFRAIYTAGFYNQAASDQLQSPYLRTVGPTRVAHYIGVRTEWWF